jgi:hypothetical protein
MPGHARGLAARASHHTQNYESLGRTSTTIATLGSQTGSFWQSLAKQRNITKCAADNTRVPFPPLSHSPSHPPPAVGPNDTRTACRFHGERADGLTLSFPRSHLAAPPNLTINTTPPPRPVPSSPAP